MEIVKITKERMEQILPQTVKDSDLTPQAKKMLATIINYHLVNSKARSCGFLAINNVDLLKSSCIGKDYFKGAMQELIECKLIRRVAGKKWSPNEKNTASEYYLIKENLTKPIKKPTSDDLLELIFASPAQNSPYYTITTSNTITDTCLVSSNSNSESNSDSESNSESDTESRPNDYKELMEYFKKRLTDECIDKDVDELNEIQESLKDELDEFNDINNYQNIFRYFIKPSIERKKEKLLLEMASR